MQPMRLQISPTAAIPRFQTKNAASLSRSSKIWATEKYRIGATSRNPKPAESLSDSISTHIHRATSVFMASLRMRELTDLRTAWIIAATSLATHFLTAPTYHRFKRSSAPPRQSCLMGAKSSSSLVNHWSPWVSAPKMRSSHSSKSSTVTMFHSRVVIGFTSHWNRTRLILAPSNSNMVPKSRYTNNNMKGMQDLRGLGRRWCS
ncbi:hypothetical protein CCHR01_10774 [Colletotrichum chrysophilum]|uniref:Uncharacterized protein n=1 Tax=Colletotrichum chrysophilum TaxID=1836956 RepID=A0AAD9AEC1_9PEZI|nr:hypothetical protein CCHR01_10774 [Colletotrichum chrysophilum]